MIANGWKVIQKNETHYNKTKYDDSYAQNLKCSKNFSPGFYTGFVFMTVFDFKKKKKKSLSGKIEQ